MSISINVVVFILYLIVRPTLTVYTINSTVDHMSRNLYISVYKQGRKNFDMSFKSEFAKNSVPLACLLDENVCAIFGIVSASSNKLGIV